LRPGKVQRQEARIYRHGTQALIANFDVVTGQMIRPTCGDTRTEDDFANIFVKQLKATKMPKMEFHYGLS
jgi:putative transposase